MWRQFVALLKKNYWIQKSNKRDLILEYAFMIFICALIAISIEIVNIIADQDTENVDDKWFYQKNPNENNCKTDFSLEVYNSNNYNPFLLDHKKQLLPSFFSYNLILCTAIPIIFANPCRFILYQMAKEKQINVIETLKVYDLSTYAYGLSFLVSQLPLLLISTLFLTLSCLQLTLGDADASDEFFQKIQGNINLGFVGKFFCVGILLGLCSLVISLSVAVPSSDPKMSSQIGMMILFVPIVAFMMIQTNNFEPCDDEPYKYQITIFKSLSFIPQIPALLLMQQYISSRYDYFNYIKYKDIKQDEGFYFGILCADLVFYSLLYLYLDQVFTNKKGFFFFIEPLFCCKKQQNDQVRSAASSIKRNSRKISQNYQSNNFTQRLNQKVNETEQNSNHIYQDTEQEENININDEVFTVQVENLNKRYNQNMENQINDVNFTIKQGETVCLIGENGSGKTTLVKIFAGLYKPDDPKKNQTVLRVCGKNILKYPEQGRKYIKLCHQFDFLFQELSPRQHFYLACEMRGISQERVNQEIEKTLNDLGLNQDNISDKTVKSLSNGMKRRVSIGQALLGEAQLIILDEPTANLSEESAQDLWNVIAKIKDIDSKRSVLVTTQDLKDIQRRNPNVQYVVRNQDKEKNNFEERKSFDMFLQNSNNKNKLAQNYRQNQNFTLYPKKQSQQYMKNRGSLNSEIKSMKHEEDKNYIVNRIFLLNQGKINVFNSVSYFKKSNPYQSMLVVKNISTKDEVRTLNLISLISTHFPKKIRRQIYMENQLLFMLHKTEEQNFAQFEQQFNQRYCNAISVAGLEKHPEIFIRKSKFIEDIFLGHTMTQGEEKEQISSYERNYVKTNINLTRFDSEKEDFFGSHAQRFNSVIDKKRGLCQQIICIILLRLKLFFRMKKMMIFIAMLFIPRIIIILWVDSPELPSEKDNGHQIGEIQQNLGILREVVPVKLQAIVFCLCSGIFLYNQVEDTEQKRRYVYNNAGFSRFAYYIGYFIFDYIVFMIPTLIIIVCMTRQTSYINYDYRNKIPTLLVFGATIIPMLYITGFFFKNRDNAFRNSGACLYLFGFFIAEYINALTGNVIYNASRDEKQVDSYFDYQWYHKILFLDPFIFNLWSLGFPDSLEIYHGLAQDSIVDYQLYYCLWQFLLGIGLLFIVILIDRRRAIQRCKAKSKTMIKGGYAQDQTTNSLKFDEEEHTRDIPLLKSVLEQQSQNQNNLSGNIVDKQNIRTNSQMTNQNIDREEGDNSTQQLHNHRQQMQEQLDQEVPSLCAFNLQKLYNKDKLTVNIKEIKFYAGKIHGVYGCNGSGKTTLLQLLCKMSGRTFGDIYYGNQHISNTQSINIHNQIGMSPEEYVIWDYLTVIEHFDIIAQIKCLNESAKLEQKQKLLQSLHLQVYSNDLAGILSGGNKRKLQIALALFGSPKYIFIDEIFQFLDPLSKENLKDYLKYIARNNQSTIVLISQNREDFEGFCDILYHMIDGKISKDNAENSLKASTSQFQCQQTKFWG
eukprot:403375107